MMSYHQGDGLSASSREQIQKVMKIKNVGFLDMMRQTWFEGHENSFLSFAMIGWLGWPIEDTW